MTLPAFVSLRRAGSHAAVDSACVSMGVVDVDHNQRNNPLACSDLAPAIFAHLHEAEVGAPAAAVSRMIERLSFGRCPLACERATAPRANVCCGQLDGGGGTIGTCLRSTTATHTHTS